MDRLVHCLYPCVAVEPMSAGDLARLVAHARSANEAAGITGVLLHNQRAFFQVLEGRPAAVEALFDRIYSDPRLARFQPFVFEPIEQRAFGDWAMGFAELTSSECVQIIGEGPCVARGSLAALDDDGARRLFDAFASDTWRTRLWAEAQSAERSA